MKDPLTAAPPDLRLRGVTLTQLAAWGLATVAGLMLGAGLSGSGSPALVGAGGALLVVSAVLAWRLASGLAGGLRQIDAFAHRLAAGDLVARLEGARCGPLAPLAERLNAMARSLAEVFLGFARMSQEIHSVADESKHNASGGDDGVRRQRDITLSSSATLEQLSVSLGMTRDSARSTAEVAEASCRIAQAGAAQVSGLADGLAGLAATVGETATAATRLGERSREIDAIVGLISEIAAQTNLLALNAAIEAARAGEQGRGFAVVADEVRVLAQRTGDATREIGERIERVRGDVAEMIGAMAHTQEKVGLSVGDAGQAVEALQRVAANAQRTQALIQDIAAASREQSEASQNIAQDIEQVAQLADANEQLVRENSELSRYLSELAVQLTGALDDYHYE
ncbi:methyl-accepting chemotaxis protein [Denitromonas iodatirespirans]|uniref:Methyl-accepting chemotaxis protein n=1 Tax=Denitromonas iodatirespirans TaxID=2795389 RepID=A0A944H7L7_DENI1|nr:methyl-accepting chemotaxis protein [Denitromonas iodatirespirans]MBT0961314.1 methyl-accepting chemotaxis protein [Denitromonas iodatirespirans]